MPPRLYWATQFLTARSEQPRAWAMSGGGPSLLGEEDGLDSLPGAFLGDGLGQVLELVQGVMVGDEHG